MGILSKIAGFIWPEARENRLYADIVYPDHSKKIHLVKLKGSNFTVDKKKYTVDLRDENVITYRGIWRVPTADYFWNVKEPLRRIPAENKGENGKLTPIGAEDAFEATESHVVSEALRSFMAEAISQTTGFILVIVAAIAGPVILYVVFNNKMREMTELLAQVAAAHGVSIR